MSGRRDPAPDPSTSTDDGAIGRGADDRTAAAAPRRGSRLHIHVLLFLLTCVTTTWAGILTAHPDLGWLDLAKMVRLVTDGLPYSASIMGILLAHEMGHFLLARWHGVPASLPYFLPVPLPPLGTMGAVIRMEGRIERRSALVDIGASGPLAGLIVAVPVLAYGLHLSSVMEQPSGISNLEGNSLLYLAIKYAVKGAVLPSGGIDVFLHPMAWAGWVGLLVTMINLMPIGQLDGGHIAFAFFGDRYARASAWLHRTLPALAVLGGGYAVWELAQRAPLPDALSLGWASGMPWVVWWVLLMVLKRASGGRYHPPVGEEPLTRARRLLCVAMIIIFALILAPIPMRAAVGPGTPPWYWWWSGL
jgi:membrane-associated protease RseP (regulator of RpoE activity)